MTYKTRQAWWILQKWKESMCILSDLFNIQLWDLICSCSHWIFTAFTHQVGHAASLFSLFVVGLSDGCRVVWSECCGYPLTVSKSFFSFRKKHWLHFHVALLLNNLPHTAVVWTDHTDPSFVSKQMTFSLQNDTQIMSLLDDASRVIVFGFILDLPYDSLS